MTALLLLALLPLPVALRPGWRTALRAAYERQVALQQRCIDRYELSGTQTLAAGQALRWRGDQLAGHVLPPV